MLVSAEVSPGVAVGSAALVAWSTLAGLRVARWCGLGEDRPWDRLAVGYSVGLFATLAVDQALVTGAGVAWRWTSPVGLAPLAMREARDLFASSWRRRGSPTLVLVVAGGALLAVGHEWLWTLPLGGAALAAAWLVGSASARRALWPWLVLAASAAGAVAALGAREGRWWLTERDTPFDEVLAASLSRWGAGDLALASGRSLRYHWFPYAWVGATDRATGAADYEVLTRVAPLVAVVGVMLAVTAVALRHVDPARLGGVVVVIAVSPVFGDWWRSIPLAMGASFSQLFAMVWLVTVPVALRAWLERPRVGRLVALGIPMVALVGGKATHAVVAAVMLAATWVTLAVRRDPRARPLLAGGLLIAATMALVGRWVFGGAGQLRFLPTDWLPYLQGDLYEWRGVARAVAAGAYMAGMVGVAVVAMLVAATNRAARRAAAVAVATMAVAVALSVFSNRGYDLGPNGLYTVHSAVTLAWIGVAIGVAAPGSLGYRRLWLPAALAGLAVLVAIPDLDSGATHAVWLRVVRAPAVLVPALLVCVVGAATRRSRRVVARAALAASVALTLAVQAWMIVDHAPGDYREWRASRADTMSSEALVAAWIRAESPPSAILATNHLCAAPACAQPEYSADTAFAVATDRRYYVAGPLFALTYSADSAGNAAWEPDRVRTSLDFGTAPDAQTLRTLREAGVGWYVAERARSGAVDWSGVGAVRYENADYLVVELRDP